MPRRHPDPHEAERHDSPEGLNPDDPGVRMLAQAVAGIDPQALLLVHCGDLPGLRGGATRLILDVRERTGSPHECVADLGRADASAPLPVAEGHYEAAVVWPRAHLGKDFSEECLATAALALREGGRLYCAVRKQKGGKSLARTMRSLLGDDAVEVGARDRGYHLWVGELVSTPASPGRSAALRDLHPEPSRGGLVFTPASPGRSAALRDLHPEPSRGGLNFNHDLATELTTRSYVIGDPMLGELRLTSRPGVFSRRELDGGTRALLAVVDAIARREGGPGPKRVVDLCAGIGPLALWAAQRWPAAKVLAVESNLRACALLRENAARNGLSDRVIVHEHDGMPELDAAGVKPFVGRTELALLNPPTHADPDTLLRLLDLRRWLAPGGRLLVVVNRPGRAVELLTRLGAEIDGGERDGYFILSASWA